jgi:hypothetical protein
MKTFSKRLQQFAAIVGVAVSEIGASGSITPANALSFNFSYDPGMNAQAVSGFQQAGTLWSSVFTDNVTVNIAIDFTDLSKSNPGTIGIAGSNQVTFSNYNGIYNALKNDRTSSDDYAAISTLPNASTLNRLINYTSENGGSATPYLNSSSAVTMTTANGKALGFTDGNLLLTPGKVDASITFASNYSWDFAHGSTIAANSYDFVGVAAHEIGHTLGFMSNVDLLNRNRGTKPADNFSVTTLDLFRYSADSKAQNAIDFTVGNTEKYFSLDGGLTKIAAFETGLGYEASHWLDHQGLGILDPTTTNGELLGISETDIRALDAIGWNRVTASNSANTGSNRLTSAIESNRLSASDLATAVPEPENYLGTFIFVAFGVSLIIKRRQKLVESIAAASEEG